MFSPGDREVLDRVLMLAEAIYTNTRPRLSATLNYRPRRMGEGKGKGERKMATIRVGQTASPVYQEWSGPNGTGDKLPPAGPVTYASDNPAAVTVDSNSGVATGVAAGTANITATDAADSLTATTQITVVEEAVSATLDYTPN